MPVPAHGHAHSLLLTLPPLATLMLVADDLVPAGMPMAGDGVAGRPAVRPAEAA